MAKFEREGGSDYRTAVRNRSKDSMIPILSLLWADFVNYRYSVDDESITFIWSLLLDTAFKPY